MAGKNIYNILDEGKRIGSYTADAAERLLGVPKNQVAIYSQNGWKYQGRYGFVPEEYEPSKNGLIGPELQNDWDFTTRALKTMAGRA